MDRTPPTDPNGYLTKRSSLIHSSSTVPNPLPDIQKGVSLKYLTGTSPSGIMGVMSKNPSNTVNLEAKSLLAKLLATEDIAVIHQNCETAMFNVETRTLTLPMWEKMDGSLYDMLVGHEVGHALFTPNDLESVLKKIDPEGIVSEGVAFDYLNVVEDARIERLMQDKFPGLRRDFVRSYNDLFSRGFFGDTDTDEIENRRIVDKVNLHYKVGRLLNVQFTAEEQSVVDMIDRANTWEEIIECARALFLLGKHEAEEGSPEDGDEENADMGMPAPLGGEDEEGEEGEGASGSGDMESDEDGDGNGAGSGEEGDEDGDGEGTAEGDAGDEQGESDGNGDVAFGAGNSVKPMDHKMKSETAEALAESIKDRLTKEDNGRRPKSNVHIGIPDTITDRYVVSVPQFISKCKEESHIPAGQSLALHTNGYSSGAKLMMQLKRFEQETKKIVAGMVQRFEMMKAASDHKRTMTSDSGVIDMTKLPKYKWEDNIFSKMEEVASGKSHGMIMYVDWSGSMCNVATDTIKQVLILAMFCEKVNIPFSCYAFVGGFRHNTILDRETTDHMVRGVKDGDWVPMDIKLVEIAGSKYKKNVTKEAMALWLGVASFNDTSGRGVSICVPEYRMAGTPLDDAIAIGVNIANEFRATHKVEILNTVIITDGMTSSGPLEGSAHIWSDSMGTSAYVATAVENSKTLNIPDGHNINRVIYSHITGKTYTQKARFDSTTSVMMEYYKDHTGSNTTRIMLTPKNRKDIGYWVNSLLGYESSEWFRTNNDRTEIIERVFKGGSEVLENVDGADQYIIMTTPDNKRVKGMDDLKEGANTRTVANAFIREKKARQKITQVMDRFVDHISKEYV